MSDGKMNNESEITSSILNDKSLGVTEEEAFVFSNKELKKFKDEEEQRLQDQKKRLFKIGSLLVILMVMFIFASIAWFTMSREVDTGGMGMETSSPTYEISPIENGSNGKYYDYYSIIHAQSSEDALVWKMTNDSNMNNYSVNDEGIEPKSHGKISFIVTPKVEQQIELTFELEIIGYLCTSNEGSGSSGTEDVTLSLVTSESVKNYLNGHILLFEDYEEDEGYEDGKYSGPITSNANMKRVFKKYFQGKNIGEQVDVYWVWPEHLSNLVNAYDGTSVSKKPFLDINSDDYEAVLNNIITYPQYYLKGNPSDPLMNNLTEQKIKDDYITYAGLYDGADNDIGTGVNYILVRLSVVDGE